MKTVRSFLSDVVLAVLIGLALAMIFADWAADEPPIDPVGAGSAE